jgi:hypothetical protein
MLISSVALQCFTVQFFLGRERASLESEAKSNFEKGLVGIATTNVVKKETKSHLDNIYAPNHASSFQQLETFLQDHPNTPGAHFVKLLRQYIHVAPGAEAKRWNACQMKVMNWALCIGGYRRVIPRTK